jgi:hypothetical protein
VSSRIFFFARGRSNSLLAVIPHLRISIGRPGKPEFSKVAQRKISNSNQQCLPEPLRLAGDELLGHAMACSLQGFPYRGSGVHHCARHSDPANQLPTSLIGQAQKATGRLHCYFLSNCNFQRVAHATLYCKRQPDKPCPPLCNFTRIATRASNCKRGDCGKPRNLWESSDQGNFENCVVLDFIGVPPFPQEETERMGHGSPRKNRKTSIAAKSRPGRSARSQRTAWPAPPAAGP